MKLYPISHLHNRFAISLNRYAQYSSTMWKPQPFFACILLGVAVLAPFGLVGAANPVPIDLGTAANFGALAGGAISGTGHVEKDIGSGTGAIALAVTSDGTVYPTGDAVVLTALDDFLSAFDEGKNRANDVVLSAAAHELGGSTFTSGVYKIGAAATLASSVTFDAEGDPDAVFIIQIVGAFGSTATTGNVLLANGAQSKNIFWVVEGAVSLGANTHMEGTILGGAAVALGAGTTLFGRVMAGSAAGTLALASEISEPPFPPVSVGDRVWLDSNGDGIQDLSETTGIPNVPVALLQILPGGLPVDLGTAADFGALAGGAISGSGHVEGDLGSGTGAISSAITSDGTIFATGNALALTALEDFNLAYDEGKNRPNDVLLSAAAYDLGNNILTQGVYKIGAAATLTSSVTFDAEGDPDAVFIIQIVGALGTTAATGNVLLTNGTQAANVFWIVEGAVSLGANTHFEGTILGGAAVTLGASTTLNGRVLAGSAAGTIALASVITEVTATPPIITPPSNVVANTITDVNGNYLFQEVLEGTYVIRWDLTSLTDDVRVTTAKQGANDSFDSDGQTGEVGEFVYTAEFGLLDGKDNLNLDIGLVETLPAIKTAAIEELSIALAIYLDESYYTAENWTALKAARANGESTINAATDAAEVSTARDIALAAMDGIPTFDETLTSAKNTALNSLATTLATYPEADYTPENWTALNTAKTNGDLAIQLAGTPTEVSAAEDSALGSMNAVPTSAETLTAAKTVARNDLEAALTDYLGLNFYTFENWTALNTAKTDGDLAINTASDPTGVTMAKDSALVAMDGIPTFDETLTSAKNTALNSLAIAFSTYSEANYSPENWTALNTAKLEGEFAIQAATDPAGVTAAVNSALGSMNTIPPIETLLGTPVTWFQTHGISPQGMDSWNAVDYYTTDSDSMLNWQEYLTGTDPNDPASYMRIVKILSGTGLPPYLEWIGGTLGPSAPYIIESTTSLLLPDWQTVGTRVRVDGINDWTGDIVLPGTTRYFRVSAESDLP